MGVEDFWKRLFIEDKDPAPPPPLQIPDSALVPHRMPWFQPGAERQFNRPGFARGERKSPVDEEEAERIRQIIERMKQR